MIALFLFLLDLTLFCMLKKWVISTLLVYTVIKQCQPSAQNQQNPQTLLGFAENTRFFSSIILPMGLLFLEDAFLYERFGLTLIYIIPLIIYAQKGRKVFVHTSTFLPILLLFSISLVQDILIKCFILGHNFSFFMTLEHICCILMVGYLVLLGTQSNRLLPLLVRGKGRKVWTPNRKGAS